MGLYYQLLKWPIFLAVAAMSVVFWLMDLIQETIVGCPKVWNVGRQKDNHPLECTQDPDLGTHDVTFVDDISLHYVVAGSEKKPLMVLVHGFPEFWYSWRYQIKEFKKDYRVVALDQRGYGQSGSPVPVSCYDLTRLALDIKTVVEYMGYQKCVLVGHDWGGLVCWRVAQAYPEIVDKLIVMNSPSTYALQSLITSSNGFTQLKKSWYILFFFQLPWIPEILLQFCNFYSLDVLFLTDPVCRNGNLTQTDMKAYKYTFKYSGMKGPVNYYRRLIRKLPARVDYTKVSAPTLIIWGDQDRFLETELATLSSELSVQGGATIRLIRGGSHFIQMEQPEIVNELMRKFLS